MAWEALVAAHGQHALHFIALLSGRVRFDEALTRYLREMDTSTQMAAAVQTRVLVALEPVERQTSVLPPLPFAADAEEPLEEAEGWRRFRPDVVMREVKERYRRNEEVERLVQLAIARAEEGIIGVHIDNAITFAALLEPYGSLGRAVEEYTNSLGLVGGRAQAVFQRTMARLAEVHLPYPEPLSPAPPTPPSRRRTPS